MNKKRKKRIQDLIDTLENAQSILSDILSEEEGLQCSEVGEISEEAQEHLNEAKDSLENVISELEEI